jgi:hypothetical protein
VKNQSFKVVGQFEGHYIGATSKEKQSTGHRVFEYELEFDIMNLPDTEDLFEKAYTVNSCINTFLNRDYLMSPWELSLNGKFQDCAPTLQNIAKELFLLAASIYSDRSNDFRVSRVTVLAKPVAITCTKESIEPEQAQNWVNVRFAQVRKYVEDREVVKY